MKTSTGHEWLDPCEPGLDEDEGHRRWMLFFERFPGMVNPDAPARLGVIVPRRTRVLLDELARHRGLRAGQLAARILERYLRRYLRTVAD